jgi:hypothetical protein
VRLILSRKGFDSSPAFGGCASPILPDLFGGALHGESKAAFEAGAGGELRGAVPSMCALHSSAAMAVNLFQYWIANREFSTLAEILRIPVR